MQRGSVLLLVLVLCLVASIAAGYWIFQNYQPPQLSQPGPQKQKTTTDNRNLYTSKNLAFEFKYSQDLQVSDDGEQQYNQRNKGDFRKNFTNFVSYEPGKVLGGISVLSKDNSFDKSPLIIWVYNNPALFDEQSWYNKYWFYPFVWGDFDASKEKIKPRETIFVGGELGRFVVIEYQPIKPKFIYLSHAGKMYLFRVLGDGEKILATLKFLDKTLGEEDKAQIDGWIKKNNLNEFGDAQGTIYTGGTPLFNESTGEKIDKYDYILKNHPDRPWEK